MNKLNHLKVNFLYLDITTNEMDILATHLITYF